MARKKLNESLDVQNHNGKILTQKELKELLDAFKLSKMTLEGLNHDICKINTPDTTTS